VWDVELSLSEILPVCCQLQLPAPNTAYMVGFRGRGRLSTICGKFAAVSHGIWQTGPQNLEKFAT